MLNGSAVGASVRIGGREVQPALWPLPPTLDIGRRVRLVARDREMALLEEHWRDVVAGHRRIVLVDGEAGIGKTRLVAELASHVVREAVLLVGHCDQSSLVPYQPMVEALRGSDAVAAAVASTTPKIKAYLSTMLGGPIQPPESTQGGYKPGRDRHALFEAVKWLLSRLAATRPVLLVLEDLERCDRSTSMLLRYLTRTLPGRVLLVMTYRDPPGGRHAPLCELLVELNRRGGCGLVSLRRFDRADLVALIEAVTGTSAPEPFVEGLLRRTGGNPFYAAEVLRYLVSQDRSGTTGRWWGRGPICVPSGVRNLLRNRLADVSETTRRLLSCAAVIGEEATWSLVGATMRVGDDELVAVVEEATGTGLLVDVGDAWSAACTFAHALVRDAVYDDIPVVHRRRLHLRVAQALLDRAEPQADALSAAAMHLRAAGPLADRDEVIDLTIRAAEAARRLYAWDEAATHAEAALAMLEEAGAPLDRRAQMAELAGTMLWVACADLRSAVRQMEAAVEYYRRAHDTRSMARLRGRLGVALATHPTVMDIPRAMQHLEAAEPARLQGAAGWQIGSGTAGGGIVGSRTEQVGVAAIRAIRVAEETGRRDHWAWSLSADAYHRFNLGDLATARELLETAWASAVDLGDHSLAWNAAIMLSLHSVAFLADPRPAEQWCQRALALGHLNALRQRNDLFDLLAVAAGTRGDLAAARHTAASIGGDTVVARFLAMWDGDWEAAQRSWQAALRNDSASGDLLDATLNAIWLAGAHVQLGHGFEAVATLRQALAWSIDGPLIPAELTVRAELARLLPVHGAVGEAAGHLARCEEILATGQDWRGRAGHFQLARAAVAVARGNESLAASAYAAAVEVFVTFDLPWQRALALGEWGRWLTSIGSPAEADAKQAGAREIYATLSASGRWYDGRLETDCDAQRMVAEEPLTTREREVLRLIADGLSDREIATRLVISPHTVHRHVANLRTKLGQPSRAAAVAYAARHKLM